MISLLFILTKQEYRKKGRAKRGEKVYGKVSGRRFERISIVAGQVKGQFVAPMIYKRHFFVKWFESQLLPALDRPRIVIIDNAPFRLDELCIVNHHFFLPLPPYSPELNPIERAWANLKKVMELLPKYKSVTECLRDVF